MNEELELHREFYGRDSGELTTDELIEAFAREDASLEWGSRLDLELQEAIKEDEKLRQLQEHNLMLQRNLLVESMKARRRYPLPINLAALNSGET